MSTATNSFNSCRLPLPQPTVFTGNPLTYADWIAAFETLIENKNLPVSDKIHYLKSYLGGEAKEAVTGFLALRNQEGYDQAMALLEERFGNGFIVSEAFQRKLNAWPKVWNRD